MFGFTDTRPTPEFITWVREQNLGGIKIFGWNAETLMELAESITILQKNLVSTRLGIPLLIATDQEGGWVRHVKAETSIAPGNMAIGATGRPIDAYKTGFYIGRELSALGINMNLAPTVDIYTNPEAHVIGPRAFSDNPLTTAVLAMAYGQGLEASGLIWTAKHFPGHGNAEADSHGALPLIYTDFATLWEEDLLPYRYLIREGLPAVMVGHIGYPDITADPEPATLSSFFISKILKEKMNFSGLVISDDLMMGGALEYVRNIEEACILSLRAGMDMIMVSRTFEIQKRVWNALLKEMNRDPTFHAQVRASALRILNIKHAFLKGDNAVPLFPDVSKIDERVPDPEGEDFFFDLACRSVTILRPKNLPLQEPGKVLLTGQFKAFLEEGKFRFPEAEEYYFSYSPFYGPNSGAAETILSLAPSYDTIIFCLANPNSLGVLKKLKPLSDKLTVFSVLTPVYLQETPWVTSAIAVYGTGEDSFQAGFAALKGDFATEGVLPLSGMN
jgi:beta-N-acetylhexosaminidase